MLEDSVKRLADALDALEKSLEERLSELHNREETIEQSKIRARTAKAQTASASEDLGAAIRDIKMLLAEDKGA